MLKKNSFNVQKYHYENIHSDYENHYYDEYSMKYREIFIYHEMFEGIDLKNNPKSIIQH